MIMSSLVSQIRGRDCRCIFTEQPDYEQIAYKIPGGVHMLLAKVPLAPDKALFLSEKYRYFLNCP